VGSNPTLSAILILKGLGPLKLGSAFFATRYFRCPEKTGIGSYWERAVPSVSLYVRRKDDRYHKCSAKAVYVLGTKFVLRYEPQGRRRWEKLPSGIDYATAKRMALEKELARYRGEIPEKRQENAHPPQPKPKPPEPGTLMLDRAIDRYLAVVKTKSARTYSGYTYTLKQFYVCVGNLALSEISKQQLYDFLAAMKEEGLGDRTCHNRCAEVSTMLRFRGINVSIRVRYTEKIVRAYRDDELQKLFTAADSEEHLLFSFFLATGAREQEIQFAPGVMLILRTASLR
jgi:hypothetical protein